MEYLYDLREDVWESNNLADDPAYHDDLVRLRNATFSHIHETNDVMFLPETRMVENAQGSTPYEKRHDSSYNPLSEILQAAQLVGGGQDVLPTQLNLLAHEQEAVRYWAAVGIFAQTAHIQALDADGDADHVIDQLRNALDHDSEIVCVDLAATLYAVRRDPKARECIEQHLCSSDPLVAHQAVEKLLYMPDIGGDFAEIVETAYAAVLTAEPPEWQKQQYFAAKQGMRMHRSIFSRVPLIRDGEEKMANEQEREPVVPTY